MQKNSLKHQSPVCYEVFIRSFRDSNDDGIGDLQGLISKLDYIRDLGANIVWITPFHPSPSYHKYDVTDYYGIHPDYGTMHDMEELIAELHKRDMKLIMDFVINHTSEMHPWFIQSSSPEKNKYSDYYVWKEYKTVEDEIKKKETTFDSDNITQWHKGTNRDEHYYGFFWKGMPDLNFDNDEVRKDIYEIGKFWIDKGVDGFRMDAAKHIYPDDETQKTIQFWREFTAVMRSYKPDVMVIGEVWEDPQALVPFFEGLPMLFNFELAKAIPELVINGDVELFKNKYQDIQREYDHSKYDTLDAILLSNHDMNRIMSVLDGNKNKAKLAASILLTLPGIPFIYYGEEIGMKGMKPDEQIREPFLWGDDNFKNKSWNTPVYSTFELIPSLSEQKKDLHSVYRRYKILLANRHDHPDIATGRLIFPKKNGNPNILHYIIKGNEEDLLIAHNISDNDAVFETDNLSDVYLGIGHETDAHPLLITLPPYASEIYILTKKKKLFLSMTEDN